MGASLTADVYSIKSWATLQATLCREEFVDQAAFALAGSIIRCNPNNLPLVFAIGRGEKGAWTRAACFLLKKRGEKAELFALAGFSSERNARPLSAHRSALSSPCLVIDALLDMNSASSFGKEEREALQVIAKSQAATLAIHLPSGIDGDTGKAFFPLPKVVGTICLGAYLQGLFFGEGYEYSGALYFAPLEFPPHTVQPSYKLLKEEGMARLLPQVRKSRHKYEAGALLGLAGSPSMMGAAHLASKAALRTGAGLVRILHLASAPLSTGFADEVIASPYQENGIVGIFQRMKALFCGPGMGRSSLAREALFSLLKAWSGPIVLDADALFFLREEIALLPKEAILTPHRGEAEALLEGISPEGSLHARAQSLASEHSIYFVLKGAPTWIFSPGKIPLLLARGSAGAATAGAGDVLTGIISSLLAQGASSLEAACLGLFLHALASEISAERKTVYGMIASDILEAIPSAYQRVLGDSS